MKPILLLNKKPGLTPLQALNEWKELHPEYKQFSLSYAGRLDPMAEGLLLVLVGEENKKRHDYEILSKTYEFKILVGFSTDTYDVMGLITQQKHTQINLQILDTTLLSFTGQQKLTIPVYSSRPVNGKPLYWYAKRNLLHTIKIPTQDITIEILHRINTRTITAEKLHSSITKRLSIVNGNFRQEEILLQWQKILSTANDYQLIGCKVTATSGTYVRGIVNALSHKLKTPMLTFSIKRTQIGPYTL